MNPIPLISFAPFLSGSLGERWQVARQIHQACCEVGFVYLQDHGLSQELIDQLFEQTRYFFAQPLKRKHCVARSAETNCGYVGLGTEQLNPDRPADPKEAFNVGDQVIWPEGEVEFRLVVSTFRFPLCCCPVLRSQSRCGVEVSGELTVPAAPPPL